jgi:hypothetical protein
MRELHSGCYLVTLASNINLLLVSDGKLRFERSGNRLEASGDLYQRLFYWEEQPS